MHRPIKAAADPIDASLKDAVVDTVGASSENKGDKDTSFTRSPLRYPGGKTRAVRDIVTYFPPDVNALCSPFIGGGSLEIAFAQRGVRVYGYDIFEPLVAFWQSLLKNPDELVKRVRKYHPLTKSKFYALRSKYMEIETKEERAAVFFVLNRCSFSGTTLSGGMSPDHPRFTESAIKRLERFHVKNLEVERADFEESLKAHPHDFLYLDPPYANGEKLYGNRGNIHENFDHERLAEILRERKAWVLSYNDCEKVRALYKGYTTLIPQWAYGMSKNKRSNELLIFSEDFTKRY